ncbi:MAG: hypothetical protein RR552_07075 [Oscillospiraceae bacterium]
MKTKKQKFVLLTIFYFLITFLDLLLTYLSSPDLSLEGNPLVVNLKFGWFELILINVITFAVYFAMAYYAYIKYKPPFSKETTLKKYLADITYDNPENAKMGMIRFPDKGHWSPQIACLCYSVSTALPIARLIIVVEWYLIFNNIEAPLFFSIVQIFPFGRIDFFIAVFIAWGLSFVWIYKEFNQNKAKILSLNTFC